MASERDSPQSVEDEEEVYDRPRPRRRFRGLHWRHASQSHSSPPHNQPSPQQSPSQIRPLSFNLNQSGFGSFNTTHSSNTRSSAPINLDSPTTSTMSMSFADELSKVFNIDEDPEVEQLESSLREKNQRLSMQTNELEMLSQRIKEAEERLRRVEEENEEMSQGDPTPPLSPEKPLPPIKDHATPEITYDDERNHVREQDWRGNAI